VATIVWLLLAGVWLFLAYVIAGLVSCIFPATRPYGIRSFTVAGFVFLPFYRTVVLPPVSTPDRADTVSVLWFVLCGWWLLITHMIIGIVLCIFIVTIPFVQDDFRLAQLTLSLGRPGKTTFGVAPRRRSPPRRTQ
jgi:uncharacterized membrane protein YccF (DUF307 family)